MYIFSVLMTLGKIALIQSNHIFQEKAKRNREGDMVPGIAIRQHMAHWAFWDNSTQLSGIPSHETVLKDTGFTGTKDLFDNGCRNLLAVLKQQMADAGYSNTSNWVISTPMPSLAERARLSFLARNAGIDRIRLIPSVAAAAVELCLTYTSLMEDMGNGAECDLIVWKDADTIEICLAAVGNGVLEYIAYGAKRHVEEKQVAGAIRKIMEEDILPNIISGLYKQGTIFINSLPSDAQNALEHLAANTGWNSCIEYRGQTDLYGCMRIAGKLSGYDFARDYLPLMITEYDYKILKNDQQTIDMISRNSTIPTRSTRPDKDHPGKIRMSDITDRFGMVTVLLSCPFSSLEYDLIRIPVYEIWNGRNAEEEAQITIDIDANLCVDISITNATNNKKLVYSWKEICEQIS